MSGVLYQNICATASGSNADNIMQHNQLSVHVSCSVDEMCCLINTGCHLLDGQDVKQPGHCSCVFLCDRKHVANSSARMCRRNINLTQRMFASGTLTASLGVESPPASETVDSTPGTCGSESLLAALEVLLRNNSAKGLQQSRRQFGLRPHCF